MIAEAEISLRSFNFLKSLPLSLDLNERKKVESMLQFRER